MDSPARASEDLLVIENRGGWRALGFRELWRHREVLYLLAWRDVKVRYRQAVLGILWAVLQPLAMTAAFAFVLGRWAKLPPGEWPYAVHVYTGMLPWVFFSNAVTSAGNSVVASERLVTKVWMPRLAIPFAAVGACLVDLLLGLLPLLALLLWYGIAPGWGVLAAPLALGLLVLAAAGMGALLSALMVAYRDVKFVMPFFVQLLLFATPSIYIDTGSSAPRTGLRLLDFHPLDAAISFFRSSVLGAGLDWGRLAIAAVMVGALFLLGTAWFRRVEDGFADVI
jgi:lipopolysaccharide transport system permease protein